MHMRVCVRAHVCSAAGAGAHVCLAPGLSRSVVLQVLGRMCVVLQVLVLVLMLVLGRGLLRSSLFTHRQNFISANPEQPRSLKINNNHICNDTRTTLEDKKRYLPGMISERYGKQINTGMEKQANRAGSLEQQGQYRKMFQNTGASLASSALVVLATVAGNFDTLGLWV